MENIKIQLTYWEKSKYIKGENYILQVEANSLKDVYLKLAEIKLASEEVFIKDMAPRGEKRVRITLSELKKDDKKGMVKSLSIPRIPINEVFLLVCHQLVLYFGIKRNDIELLSETWNKYIGKSLLVFKVNKSSVEDKDSIVLNSNPDRCPNCKRLYKFAYGYKFALRCNCV